MGIWVGFLGETERKVGSRNLIRKLPLTILTKKKKKKLSFLQSTKKLHLSARYGNTVNVKREMAPPRTEFTGRLTLSKYSILSSVL